MDETRRRLYPADAGVREARAGGERAGLVLFIRGETLFLFFFRPLVRRVRGLQTLWWVVLACVVVGAMASIPLAFIVCANFSDDYMRKCPDLVVPIPAARRVWYGC